MTDLNLKLTAFKYLLRDLDWASECDCAKWTRWFKKAREEFEGARIAKKLTCDEHGVKTLETHTEASVIKLVNDLAELCRRARGGKRKRYESWNLRWYSSTPGTVPESVLQMLNYDRESEVGMSGPC